MKNLIISRSRDIPLLTNDSKLYRKAVKKGVKVYDLRQILKSVYLGGLVSKNKLKDIVGKIEEKDNTNIKEKEDLFRR